MRVDLLCSLALAVLIGCGADRHPDLDAARVSEEAAVLADATLVASEAGSSGQDDAGAAAPDSGSVGDHDGSLDAAQVRDAGPDSEAGIAPLADAARPSIEAGGGDGAATSPDAGDWLLTLDTPELGGTSLTAVALAPDGAFYVAGSFVSSATLPSSDGARTPVKSESSLAATLLARYSAAGVVQWAVAITGSAGVWSRALAVMPDGGVVLTGIGGVVTRFGQAGAGPFVLDVKDDAVGPYLARYAPSGALSWAIAAGCDYGTWNGGNGLAVTADAIYWAGITSQNVMLPSAVGAPILLAGQQNGAGFVARYTHAGAAQWAVGITQGESVMNAVVAVGDSAIAGGHFRFPSQFESKVGAGIMRNSSNYYEDGFIARYRNDGKLEWLDQIGGIPAVASWGQVRQLAVDRNGRLLVGGVGVGSGGENTITFENTNGTPAHGNGGAFLASYSSAGVFERIYNFAGETSAVFASDLVFVVGSYRWQTRFSGAAGQPRDLPLPAKDEQDGFLVAFDDSGAIAALDAISGTGDQVPAGVVASADAVIVVGTFVGELKLRALHSQGLAKVARGFIAHMRR